MTWHIPTYLILSLFLAITSLALTWLAWLRRNITQNQPLVLVMFANTFWLVAYFFGLVASDLTVKIFWQQVQDLFMLCIPTLALFLLLTFFGNTRWLKGIWLVGLLVEPVLGILVLLTNSSHHFMWTSMQQVNVEGYSHIEVAYGAWLWIHLAYTVCLILLGIGLLVRHALRNALYLRNQSFLLLFSISLTGFGLLLDLLAPPTLHGLRYSSLLLLLSGILLVIALDTRQARYLLPLAREVILENMRDAVIVLDPQDVVIDLNQSACQILGKTAEQVVGSRLGEACDNWPALATQPDEISDSLQELRCGTGDAQQIYDLRLSPVFDRHGHLSGRLMVLHDITRRKRAEETLERRDQILQVVSFAAERFLKSTTWDQDIMELLTRLGNATQVSRIYLYEKVSERGKMYDVLRHEWVSRDTIPLDPAEAKRRHYLGGSAYMRWIERLSQGQAVYGLVRELPEVEQTSFVSGGVLSIAVVPIFVDQQWWGYIGLDDCCTERVWSSAEIDALRTAASTLGAAIELTRLYAKSQSDANEAKTRSQQLTQLNEITRTAIGSYGFKETLKMLADSLVTIISSDICFINLWDSQQKTVISGAVSGSYDQLYQSTIKDLQEMTMTEHVLQTGKPLLVKDIRQSEFISRKFADLYPLVTALAIPMIVGQQKLGSIIFAFHEYHHLTDEETKISEQFADQVALVISKAWALEVAHQRAQEADNLRQASAAISSSLELSRVLDSILVRLETVIHYDSACIFLREGDRLRAVAGRGLPESGEWYNRDYALDDLYLHASRTKKPVILHDAQQEARFQGWGNTSYVRGWMGVPLMIRDKVIGLLSMDSRQPGYFTSNHARLVGAFAGQVAVAIENARLYQETRLAAEGRMILHRISQEVITASFDTEQIYLAVHRAAAQLMPVDTFTIALLNRDEQEVETVYLVDHDQRSSLIPSRPDQGVSERVIHSGESLYIADITREPGWQAPPEDASPRKRSVLAVPLRTGERVIGVLSCQADTAKAYNTESQHLLEMLAAYAGIAIENSRLIKKIQWLAITDPLTGLFNRRGLFDLGQREADRFRRYGHSFSVLLIDIDLFKKINDAYGHTTGDQVLVALAEELKRNSREVDIIGRYGGEEFVIILPVTDLAGGVQAAERLRQKVEALVIPTQHGDLTITISLGVAEFNEKISELETLVDRADSAMYRAKQAGRNQVKAF